MTLIEILQDEQYDWPNHDWAGAKRALWFVPTVKSRPLWGGQLMPQPMYVLRKMVAKKRDTLTQSLPARILDALVEIEQGDGTYLWAFDLSHDLIRFARMASSPHYRTYHRPETFPQHKTNQLYELFPINGTGDDIEITLLIGQGIVDHPGIVHSPGAGSFPAGRQFPRSYWDFAGYFYFDGLVGLVKAEEEVQPITLSLTQLTALWQPFMPYKSAPIAQSQVRLFRNALAEYLTQRANTE